jgi:Flp pilus assembly secretin CpaC
MKLTIVLCAVVIGIIAVLLIKPPPLKVRHPVKLETRVFKVDAHLFSTNAVSPKVLSSRLGVDLTAPGRSVAFNDKQGLLFVKATASELHTVERAIQALNQINPQIHIKVRFIEVPKDGFVMPTTLSNNVAGQMAGILSDPEFRTALQALEHRQGVETLAEPECVTTSGRQTQMRATDISEFVTNFSLKETSTNSAAVPQTQKIETGSTVDVVPWVLSDGYTIDLNTIVSQLKFIGYDQVTNEVFATNSIGKVFHLPTVSPGFRVQKAIATVNLWDGQTLVLGNLKSQFVGGDGQIHNESKFLQDAEKKNGTADKELLVFITATIVDPAGNRVHSDDELRQIQEKSKSYAPPQPNISTPSR